MISPDVRHSCHVEVWKKHRVTHSRIIDGSCVIFYDFFDVVSGVPALYGDATDVVVDRKKRCVGRIFTGSVRRTRTVPIYRNTVERPESPFTVLVQVCLSFAVSVVMCYYNSCTVHFFVGGFSVLVANASLADRAHG